MDKQKRQAQENIKFFDYMQEQMETENRKKRRTIKKPSQSQPPEMSFLQFKPNANHVIEDLCYLSSKSNSQPSGSISHKMSWRPPIKVFNTSGTVEPINIPSPQKTPASQCLEEKAKESKPHCSENIHMSIKNTDIKCGLIKDSASEKDLHPNLPDNECPSNNKFSNGTQTFNESQENGNNNHLALCSAEINLAGNSIDISKHTVEHNNSDRRIMYIGELCGTETQAKEIESAENGEDNSSFDIIEHTEFSEMPTQENPDLRLRKHSDCVEHKPNENIKTEFFENEDIINSIDLVLSEGQQSNPCEKEMEENFENKVKFEVNNFSVVDSIKITSSPNKIELSKVDCQNSTLNEPSLKQSEMYKDKGFKPQEDICVVDEVEVVETVKVSISQKDCEEKNIHLCQEKEKNKSPPPAHFEEGKNKTNSMESVIMLEQTFIKDNKDDSVKETITMPENENDIAEDENSCLMISNSQLMEIEKQYCETTQNKEQSPSTNKSRVKDHGFSTCAVRNCVSIGTQTNQSFPPTFQHGVPSQVLPVQWPKKMEESQRKLREIIQEIERLNAILLRVRREIWPQRNKTDRS